jgi:anti-sigma B factor antagonist
MPLDIRTADDVAVVTLEGTIDSRTAPALEGQLRDLPAKHAKILIGMSRVDFLSSAGLRLLLLLYRQVKARGGQIALVDVSEDIRDVMANTGFLQFFTLAETEERGLAALRGQGAA